MNFSLTLTLVLTIAVAILLAIQNPFPTLKSEDLFHVLSKSIAEAANNSNSFFSKARLTMSPLLQRHHLRASKFREWVERELTDFPEIHSWIINMPDPPLKALSNSTSNYCTSLNIDIYWLFGCDLDVAPGVRESVKKIVSEYLSGCLNAVNHKEAIMLFSIYHQLISPKQLRHKIDLRRSVFKKITALGLSEPIPPHELIMSSEMQRQELAASALRAAASKDWEAFSEALSNVLAENGQASK
jgi:hypothetical protein